MYSDKRISCDALGVTVRRYHFPIGSSKRIAWSQLRKIWKLDMGTGINGGRWRIWGSGDFRHWFNLDPQRPKKRWAYVLDLGAFVRPVITPDDPDAFERALAAQGKPVEPSPYRE